MTKVAIKSRISLLSVEFITSWTFFQSWALKDKDGKQQTDREKTFAMRGNAKPFTE